MKKNVFLLSLFTVVLCVNAQNSTKASVFCDEPIPFDLKGGIYYGYWAGLTWSFDDCTLVSNGECIPNPPRYIHYQIQVYDPVGGTQTFDFYTLNTDTRPDFGERIGQRVNEAGFRVRAVNGYCPSWSEWKVISSGHLK